MDKIKLKEQSKNFLVRLALEQDVTIKALVARLQEALELLKKQDVTKKD